MKDIYEELEQEFAKISPVVDPLDEIWTEARGPKQVWRPTANVALIYQQHCRTCDHSHSFFMGWFTEQRHTSDRHVRRLVQGRSPGLSALVERQSHGLVDYCADCVETQVIIDNAAERGGK